MKKVIKNKTKKIGLGAKNELIALGLLAPSIILFLIFKYYPILSGVFVSFFEIDIVNLPGKFVGFDNYVRAFQDSNFYAAIWHNVKMFIYSVLMNFWCPLLLAVLVDEVRRGKTFFRMMYFIPAIAPAIAMTIIWKYFWNPDYGLANYLLNLLGFESQMWLNSKSLVYFCLHFPGFIICGGMNLVIYLAALQDVPKEHYEAAYLDGAGVLGRVWYVTLPAIKNQIMSLFVLSLITSFNSMENIMIMTDGGPSGSTETLLLYAYKEAVNQGDYSYAITLSTIAFVFIMIVTAFTLKTPSEE